MLLKPAIVTLACAAMCLVTLPAAAQHIGQERLYYGVAYYPEAWDFETVKQDIALMKEARVNVVRMGEFSWNLMEPQEGVYEFDWLKNVIYELHRNDIDVVLGTPTATPPVWMSVKYPEIYVTKPDGSRRRLGSRRNASYTNPTYREFSRKICEEMAKAVGSLDGVIGWQTDNEFHKSSDYSQHTKKRWVEWLTSRYGSIERLNKIWATNLWSQEYQAFEQIPMPYDEEWHHASLKYEWSQFCSHQVVDYQALQLEAIRKHSSLPITHDGMPGQAINYPDLFEDLDFMATNFYHSYPRYPMVVSNFDRLRGYGKGMHWVFETAPNHSGGGDEGRVWFIHEPDGALRSITHSLYASGGQGTMFWLWRQHPAGHEMPHGAFVSAWGKPAANFDDLKQIGRELEELTPVLMKNPVMPAQVGLFYSHVADMGLRVESQQTDPDRYYTMWTDRFYSPLQATHLHRNVVHEWSDLDDYKLLAMPVMPTVDQGLKKRLMKWVEDGGTLMVGPMTGYRDEYYTAYTDHAIGDFGKWMGVEVESRLPVDTYNTEGVPKRQLSMEGVSYGLGLWTEALSSKKGTVLATYSTGHMAGQPAIIETKVGKGKVVYLGTCPSAEAMSRLYLRYAQEQGIAPLASGGDESVYMVPRGTTTTEYMAITNLSPEQQTVVLQQPLKKDLLSGETFSGPELMLDPFEVIFAQVETAEAYAKP